MGEGPTDGSRPRIGGGGMMHLRRLSPAFSGGMRMERQQVRCMEQVSDASDIMGRASNIDYNSNRDCQ